MINSMRRTGVLVLAALTFVVSARCSSSGGNPATSGTAGSSGPGGGGPPESAATDKAVRKAFTVSFNSDTAIAQSQAALQHGAVFHKTLIAQGKTDYAKKSSATVDAVTKVSKKVS